MRLFKNNLILLLAITASEAALAQSSSSKPRTNYLKPKEIRKRAQARQRRFDLRQPLNYLKVKITDRNKAGVGSVVPTSCRPEGSKQV
jgi:hypothetical protein